MMPGDFVRCSRDDYAVYDNAPSDKEYPDASTIDFLQLKRAKQRTSKGDVGIVVCRHNTINNDELLVLTPRSLRWSRTIAWEAVP